jgi:hypothetical protein
MSIWEVPFSTKYLYNSQLNETFINKRTDFNIRTWERSYNIKFEQKYWLNYLTERHEAFIRTNNNWILKNPRPITFSINNNNLQIPWLHSFQEHSFWISCLHCRINIHITGGNSKQRVTALRHCSEAKGRDLPTPVRSSTWQTQRTPPIRCKGETKSRL